MINNSISKAVFKGNDVATQFPFEFKIWDISQLYLEVSSSDGIVTVVTNFSAVLNDSGGVVTYLHDGAPLPTGWTLAILRNMPFTQHVDLINGTRFNPEVIEDALDKATAERQELREGISRAVQVDASSDVRPEELIQELRDNTSLAVSSAQGSAQSATAAQESANDAAASASAAQKSADDAAKSASEAGEAAGEAAVARVEAEGDTQVARVQTEGDTVLSSMAELASTAFLPGMVVAFTGSFGGEGNKHPIPTGSTEPDLTWRLHEPSSGRFILGGNGANQGAQGGTAGTGGNTGATTLTEAQMPYHAHRFTAHNQGGGGTYTGSTNGVNINAYNNTNATGGSQPHTHTQDLPPYYVLAYIEKLPTSGGGSGDIFVSQETFNNAVTALENGKQDTLVAGDNITIEGNRISSTGGGGGGGSSYDDTEVKQEISSIQRQLIYARPNQKGMVRVSDVDSVVQLHLTGDDDTISVENFPLQNKPIKVLSIGNSFSDDLQHWLGSLVKTTGATDFTLCNASIGGSSLSIHVGQIGSSTQAYSFYQSTFDIPVASYARKSLLEAITADSWDVVTLQQVSGDSGLYDTITPYLQTLINYVKENCTNKDVKIVYHMAWSYSSDSTHVDFPNYGSSQKTMYEAQSQTARKILENYPDVYSIIPSNTVVQNARSIPTLNAIGDELTRDGYHIDLEEGRTLLGLGMIQHLLYPLYGISIDAVRYSELPSAVTTQLSEDEFNLMIPVVKTSFVHPFDALGYFSDTYEMQKKLVSGVDIKTINNQSILGTGNISISGGSGSEPSVVEDLVSTAITITLAGNTIYKYGELSNLTIEAQDSSYIQSLLYFTSGATPTVVTYPEDAGHIPNTVTIEADTAYVAKVQGGYFEVLKRVEPVTPEPPDPPVPSEFTEYVDYTTIQGFCNTWYGGGLTMSIATSETTAEYQMYTTSASTPSEVGDTTFTIQKDYIASKRPLSLPSGTKLEILEGVTARVCSGRTLSTGSRGNTTVGPVTVVLSEDSFVVVNILSESSVIRPEQELRADLNTRLKILVPTDKLGQVNNNEV